MDNHQLDGLMIIRELIHLLAQENVHRRSSSHRNTVIPEHPAHGFALLDGVNKKMNPVYSVIGRLQGLAEMRRMAQTLTELKWL